MKNQAGSSTILTPFRLSVHTLISGTGSPFSILANVLTGATAHTLTLSESRLITSEKISATVQKMLPTPTLAVC
jgi:hypothetical protein